MMKRTLALLWAAMLMTMTLTGCGGSSSGSADAGAAADVDLTAVWNEVLALESEWSEEHFGDLAADEELLESYYPGLKDIPAKQLIVRAPMMSAVVNEFVFMQCESEEDAAKAAEILQKRAEDQAAGGAWYPESMAAWEKAQVLTEGSYVALVASAQFQAEAAEIFTSKFA